MNGNLNLKIFLSFSLGLHLLLFSISSLLFPDFKINRLRTLNIEVSFLPLISEKKEVSKSISAPKKRLQPSPSEAMRLQRTDETPPPDVPVQIATQDQRVLTHKEEKEAPDDKKEQESDPLFLKPENKVIPIGAPSNVTSENAYRESENKNEQGITLGWGLNPHPEIGFPEKTQAAMSPPPLSYEEALFDQPRYDENPKPIYPPEARKKRYEGEVILRVEVLQNGRVGQVDVKKSSGYDLLDRSALKAVKQWKFVPAKKGEKAIPLWVNIPVKFQLQ